LLPQDIDALDWAMQAGAFLGRFWWV